MPFHTFSEAQLRNYSKAYIESLELWLRRIIDETLRKAYGSDYFDVTDTHGNNLISKKVKNHIENMVAAEPHRFPRLIDACLLETEIKIITNPVLYDAHFRQVFEFNFPEGRPELLTFLNRLISPRNKLYHANPISIREAERVVCYTNDIIDSIKNYYQTQNMNQSFNVPLIIKYSDSFGNTFFRNQFHGKTLGGFENINLKRDPRFLLRPGDKITIEIEIDPTFSKDEYSIIWHPEIPESENKTQITYIVQNKNVGETFSIGVTITSNKDWHRLNRCDDRLAISFTVLPPL